MIDLARRGARSVSPNIMTNERRRRGGVALVGIIGGYFGVCILLGLVIGWFLDRFLHTAPLFLIAGVVLGFILSFFFVYRLAMGELSD